MFVFFHGSKNPVSMADFFFSTMGFKCMIFKHFYQMCRTPIKTSSLAFFLACDNYMIAFCSKEAKWKHINPGTDRSPAMWSSPVSWFHLSVPSHVPWTNDLICLWTIGEAQICWGVINSFKKENLLVFLVIVSPKRNSKRKRENVLIQLLLTRFRTTLLQDSFYFIVVLYVNI